MAITRWAGVVGATFLVLAGLWGCKEVQTREPVKAAVVRVEAPKENAPKTADNSGCLVCHMYFDSEKIVVLHAKKNILCVTCHGASEPHRIDETLRTKADILWGRSQVEALCLQCHKPHKPSAKLEAFRQAWRDKARPNGRFIGENAVCTDCHGEHTIPPKM